MCSEMPIYQPHVIPVRDRQYRLEEPYTCTFYVSGSWQLARLTIEKGFTYDGASVPRILWSLSGLTPDGLLRAASLVHDYIYINKGELPGVELCVQSVNSEGEVIGAGWRKQYNVKVSRRRCDRIFLKMMISAGMRRRKAYMAWVAVRLAGWVLWNKPKKV